MTFARPFDHLVFDLDDTLLDTFRQLLPLASRDACTAMIDAGLQATLGQAQKAWDEHRGLGDRGEIFASLVERFGVRGGSDPATVAHRGFHCFYNRKIDSHISLFDGVHELLTNLHGSYRLHLVTAGSRGTQEEKIRILELPPHFDSISHVDPSRGETKYEAFAQIMRTTGCAPDRHLSIGNRIDTDISEARKLGWKACWIRYGEHAATEPSTPLEYPDFTIDNVTDLVEKCRL